LHLCCSSPYAHEIYTPALHDALPIFERVTGDEIAQPHLDERAQVTGGAVRELHDAGRLAVEQDDVAAPDVGGFHLIIDRPSRGRDRKSTRLNSSHEWISYAVFCLKKK